jgi:ABC-2 type transport system ATP-binding protein
VTLMRLDLADISLKYDNVVALDHITATLEGGVIGLLGANGSGKTSLLEIIAGVKAPTAGRLLLDGEEMVRGRKTWISYLPQESGFFPFTQLPSRTLELSLAFRGIDDPEAPRRILEALGLAGDDRSADGYSGGMKQKLRIASALVHAPRVLILDEPTTGLDVRERLRVLRLIERLGERVGVVFSTQAPRDAEVVCDAVLVLAQGQAVAAGSPDAITRRATGRVFEVSVASATLPEEKDWEIVEAARDDRGLRLRIVGEAPPGARPLSPRLDDAYMLLTKR